MVCFPEMDLEARPHATSTPGAKRPDFNFPPPFHVLPSHIWLSGICTLWLPSNNTVSRPLGLYRRVVTTRDAMKGTHSDETKQIILLDILVHY